MKQLLFLVILIFSTFWGFSQNVHVNGEITEKDSGLPIPGATIQVKGSQSTAVSDRNGRFRMYAEPGDALEIKFVGFITQTVIAPEDEHLLEIKLEEDVRLLSEVVVTGALGIRRAAKEVGGGAQVISNEQLNQ